MPASPSSPLPYLLIIIKNINMDVKIRNGIMGDNFVTQLSQSER
jgi:hypothetical protein